MTNFIHWRKMTWMLLLWSAYVVTWTAVTAPGPAMAALWWLAGTVVFGLLWLGTQPLFQQGRGLGGMFLKPGWSEWRVVDLHRTHAAAEVREVARVEATRGAAASTAVEDWEDEGGAIL